MSWISIHILLEQKEWMCYKKDNKIACVLLHKDCYLHHNQSFVLFLKQLDWGPSLECFVLLGNTSMEISSQRSLSLLIYSFSHGSRSNPMLCKMAHIITCCTILNMSLSLHISMRRPTNEDQRNFKTLIGCLLTTCVWARYVSGIWSMGSSGKGRKCVR